MKAIRSCLLVVVALIAAVFLVGAFLRSEWRVERSTVVAAPPARVHAFVEDLERWPQFVFRDPQAQLVYGATRKGAGARVTWTSQGAERVLSIVSSDPASVRFTMEQARTGDASAGEIRLAPEGTGTRVTWIESGDVGWNPVPRMMLPKVIEPLLSALRAEALGWLARAFDPAVPIPPPGAPSGAASSDARDALPPSR